MLTFADGVDLQWNGLLFILQQPDFDPSSFRVKMAARGYARDFLPKRLFKDAVAALVQRCSVLAKWGRDSYYYSKYRVAVNGFARLSPAVAADDTVARLGEFVADTPYFDKWLPRWRVVDESAFVDFADVCLSSWTKTSWFSYVREYSLRRNPGVVEAMRPLIDKTADKTLALLGKLGFTGGGTAE